MCMQALTHGVDFLSAEEYLDMVAAHKHRKRVSHDEWPCLSFTSLWQVNRWVEKNVSGEWGKRRMSRVPHKTAFLSFSKKHLQQFELELSSVRGSATRTVVRV